MLPFICPNIFEVVIYTYKRVTHSEETLQNETRNPRELNGTKLWLPYKTRSTEPGRGSALAWECALSKRPRPRRSSESKIGNAFNSSTRQMTPATVSPKNVLERKPFPFFPLRTVQSRRPDETRYQ